MKYIIATDFDGTLSQYHKGGISEEVKQAIKDFRAKGNLFGVVTGRSYIWAYPVFKKLNQFEFDFILSDNGAQCVDKDGNFLFSNKIKAYKGFAKDYIMTVLGFGQEVEEAGVSFETVRYNFKEGNPDGDGGYFSNYSVLDELCEFDEFPMVNAVCVDDESAERLRLHISEKFGEYLCPARNGRCLDITAVGVNKATGIKQYADIAGVDVGYIYSAGNNYNDMVMIKAFHGCAVENAVTELKNQAEYVVEDVGEIVNIILSKEKNDD